MRFRKKKGKYCDIAKYVLEKASKIRQNCTIQWTVMTSLAMKTSILIGFLPRNHLHRVQAKIKISCLEHS